MQDLCVSERARQLRSALEDFTYNDRKLFLRQGFMVYSVLLCKHCYKHYGFQVSNGKKEGKDVSAFFSYQIKSTTKKWHNKVYLLFITNSQRERSEIDRFKVLHVLCPSAVTFLVRFSSKQAEGKQKHR